ncbi:MAG: tetratricopeptide repeat protein [Muribaculaceae bacterium]|nr:tetratricopeptide repeat protein [Muribaculaceae bacterium]
MLLACAALMANAQGYKDGIDFFKIGKYDDAKELLERNLSTASNKAEAYYYLGQVALYQGDKALAKSYYDKGVQANPKYPFNYVGLAAVELENGNTKAAENYYKQAEKCEKKNPKVAVAMAKAYFIVDADKYAKQIEKLTGNAFKWNPEDPDYYIFQGDMLGVQKQWGAAAGQYDLASQRDPNNIESHVKYTNVDFFLNPERALKSLEELLQRVPNNALVQRELAEKYFENKDYNNALKYYGIYYNNPNHFPKDEARYVQLLWLSDNNDKAIEVCNEIIANPAYPAMKFFGYRYKLYNQCDKKDWEAAANTGAEFFNLADKGGMEYDVRDYSYYANALNGTNRGAEAIQTFERAMEMFPKEKGIRKQVLGIYNDNKDYVMLPSCARLSLTVVTIPKPTFTILQTLIVALQA